MSFTKFRYKDGHNAAVKALHTRNFIPEERLDRRNTAIITELFNRTQNGLIKGFYLVSDTSFKAYHRSSKEAGKIQLSSGFYKDGQLYPCYDCQFLTAAEAIREGIEPGNYAIIGG